MESEFHYLSPVEVVKVTKENLEEVAAWCGGTVHETESRRVPGRMDSYVWVPTPRGQNTSWAFAGMMITKRVVITVQNEVRVTWAVFRKDYFDKNYFVDPKDALDKTWDRHIADQLATSTLPPAEDKKKRTRNKTGKVAPKWDAMAAGVETKTEKVFVDGEFVDKVVTETSGGPVVHDDVTYREAVEMAKKMSPTAEVEARLQSETPVPGMVSFNHGHSSEVSCEEAGCAIDCVKDGRHVFNDRVIVITQNGMRVED